jgi:hypothetical protein
VIDAQMAARLQELGSTASLELSPAQAHSPKLKYTLVGALDGAAADRTAPPLQHGTRVFVNMVKKSIEHFAEVGAAAAALRDRGMVPVAHLPASRFDSEEQLESTLAELARQTGGADGGPPDVLLLGGKNYCFDFDRTHKTHPPFCAFFGSNMTANTDVNLPSLLETASIGRLNNVPSEWIMSMCCRERSARPRSRRLAVPLRGRTAGDRSAAPPRVWHRRAGRPPRGPPRAREKPEENYEPAVREGAGGG